MRTPYRPRLLDIPDRQVMIPGEVVDERTAVVAAQLTNYIDESLKNGVEVSVSILATGAMRFAFDLLGQASPYLTYGMVQTSRYPNGAETGGEVRIEHDGVKKVRGTNHIIIDDIVDEGVTAEFVRQHFLRRGARKVLLAAMLSKLSRRTCDIEADLLCFNIEDHFVYGRGMDAKDDERLRNEYDVCFFAPEHPGGTLYWIP